MVVNCDVAVVGAGPAGSAAALALARGGADVAILEKDTLPRYKTCGGGVTYRAMRFLPPGLGAAVERECFRAELNFVDAGLQFHVTRSEPIVYMTMRAQLDRLLVRCAEVAGARLLDDCRVDKISTHRDCVALSSTRGRVRARFLIAADGAGSLVARKLNWTDGRRLIPALEWEVRTDPESFALLNRAARFDFGLVPGGYAWVFPKQKHLSIGLASMSRGRMNLLSLQQHYLQTLPIHQIIDIQRHGFTIPVSPRSGPLAAGRTFLVGDAAGLTDPVTAEGIGYAVISGQAAAAALLDSRWDVGVAAADYCRRIRQTVVSEWRAGRLLARLLYGMPRARSFLFRRQGQRLSEAMTEVIMGHRTYPEILRRPASFMKT